MPERLSALHTFFPNPARAAWPVHLFLADATRDGARDLHDEAERVALVRMSAGDLDVLIAAGGIVDPSLLIARAMAAAVGRSPPLGARPAPDGRVAPAASL